MELFDKIKKDLLIAIKSNDVLKKTTLRTIIGEINRHTKNVSDGDVIKIIKKMHQNAIEFSNNDEASILDVYLPKELSESEIEKIVDKIINDGGYTSMKDMGKIMGEINKHPKTNQINKKTVNNIIKRIF